MKQLSTCGMSNGQLLAKITIPKKKGNGYPIDEQDNLRGAELSELDRPTTESGVDSPKTNPTD